jgi:hypothetical protein
LRAFQVQHEIGRRDKSDFDPTLCCPVAQGNRQMRFAGAARSQKNYVLLPFQESQAGLTSALSRLLAVVENYPDLKANQNFLALQAQLEGTENRIAVARRDYIQSVRSYNTTLRTFPSILWAKLWFTDNEPFQNFTVAEDKIEAPKVDFGTQTQGG